VVDVEGDVELDAEGFNKSLVGVGFCRGADAVVNMGCGKAYAEGVVFRVVGGVEGEEEGDGVGSAGEGYADAVAGLDVVAIEGEGRGCGHAALILSGYALAEFEWWEWIERESGRE
jgi:hypothetical protein